MPVWAAVTVVLVATAGAVMAWRPSCRFVVGHVWCTVTRHRLRSCLVQSRMMNYRGYVPWCLWVRPTKVGERVWLLMRPGICVEDLEAKTPQIAAACWARDARVRAWRRLVAVVAVDVIRRDPLTTGRARSAPRCRRWLTACRRRWLVSRSTSETITRSRRLRDDAEEWELGPDASSAVLREAVRSAAPAGRPRDRDGCGQRRSRPRPPGRPRPSGLLGRLLGRVVRARCRPRVRT